MLTPAASDIMTPHRPRRVNAHHEPGLPGGRPTLPILWDLKINEAQVQLKLSRLSRSKAAVYALACLTHARDVVLASHSPQLPTFHVRFLSMASIVDRFWSEYPNCLETITSTLQAGPDVLPDEQGDMNDFVLAEDVWMDGVAIAFELFQTVDSERVALDTLNAIDRAYVFVYTYHHELHGIQHTDADIRNVESNSKYCIQETEFQITLLDTIYTMQGMPPPYPELISLI